MDSVRPDNQLDKIYDEESARLEGQWRRIHLRTMLILSLVTVAVELVFSLVLRQSELIHAGPRRYALRYLLIPALTYCALDAAAYASQRFLALEGKARNYLVSLAFLLQCMAVCFFHGYFVVVFAGGTLAIALTTLYGDQRLTGITTLILFGTEILIDLLPNWDPAVTRDATYQINICLVIIIQLCIYLVSIMIVQWENKRRRAVVLRQVEIENLRWTAARDPLTGVRNRLGLRRHIDEVQGPKRYAMMDIDHFKSVNDRWGHTAGDRVLADLGRILLEKENDKIAAFRFGGDEFLLVFTGCGAERVKYVCDEVQRRFSRALSAEMREAGVGLSLGISAEAPDLSPSAAIRQADDALYRAKHGAAG
jgi:diguanylate cyclase (GGDEF)-like protein